MREETPLPNFDVVVRSDRVVLPPYGVFPLAVAVRGERIVALLEPDQPVSARRVIDARGQVVLPGLIDPHTHIPYVPRRGMPLEEMASHFASETASALVGGVTTLFCMYRNPIPYEEIFPQMLGAGAAHSRIDFSFHLGIVNDAQLSRIPDYYREFGVTSFKFYMHYGGREAQATASYRIHYDDGLLYEAMGRIADVPGGIAAVHPENIAVIERLRRRLLQAGRDGLAAWSESRPPFTEAESVRRALYLAEQANCPLYIPHVSCRKTLEAVKEHRSRRTTPVYVETCPHYLTHTRDSEVGLLGKVNPPLREDEDRDALWLAMGSGDVDTVGTDHCGLRMEDKGPDVWTATPGFPGMATMLPVLLEGVRQGRLSLLQVAMLTSYNAARIFGLYPRKGTLLPGSDADLTIVDPDRTDRVTAQRLQSRSDFSLYEGWELTGWPVLTMVRGQVAMENGRVLVEPGYGRYLRRDVARVGG